MSQEQLNGAQVSAILKQVRCETVAQGVWVWMPITYFALWMNRLMGWMPELGRCAACGLVLDSKDGGGGTVWYSSANDGVTCADDRKGGSTALSAESVALAMRMFRGTVKGLAEEDWPKTRA